MPFAINQQTRLYWEERGSGPPVLLIMGLSFTHEMWFRVLPLLTRAGYRAILFDNRGMGRSDCPRGVYSIRRMAQDAVAVLDAVGIGSAHVIGASMGGMIAQELALRYPDRVESLVLGCTTYSGLFGTWPRLRFCGPFARWFGTSREQRERSLQKLLYAAATPPGRIQEDLNVRCGCAWSYRGFFGQFAGVLLWNSYRRLARIHVPTLILHGAEDRLVPVENGRVLASRIPNARLEILPDAGHILITDQPDLSARLLLDFLNRLRRRGSASTCLTST